MKNIVFGKGINNSNYKVNSPVFINKRYYYRCPYFYKWNNMIRRVYTNQKGYENVTVCKEWLVFSNFKKWMEGENWENNELDKDIIKPNNKIYSPETCCFVNKKINMILNYKQKTNSVLPVGVSYHGNKFRSQCNYNGKRISLGVFSNCELAYKAYVNFKCKVIKEIINDLSRNIYDIRIINGLKLHIELLNNSI